MSLDVEQQIQRQINEFLPKKLKFIKTETINPTAKKTISIDNRIDVDYDDAEELMKWKLKNGRNAGRGYFNAHSNCYMISVLQVLTHTAPFYNYMTQQKIKVDDIFFKELERIMKEAFEKNNQPLKPIVFEKNLKKLSSSLQRYQQEDATEFYLLLLDHLHEAIIGKGKNKISAISSIFHVELVSRITCYNCTRFNDHDEHFSVLPIEITKQKTLESGFDQFFKKEMISHYHCEKCNTKSNVSKYYFFKRLPWILPIQLKRFTWDEKKINGKVAFPLQLNISKYGMDGLYDLYAIVVHLGKTKFSGHYISYCKTPSGGWFRFDDEEVKPVSIKVVLQEEAYMLFYSKSEEKVSTTKEIKRGAIENNNLEKLNTIVMKENEQNDKPTEIKEETVFINNIFKSSRIKSIHQLINQKYQPIKRKPEEPQNNDLSGGKITSEEMEQKFKEKQVENDPIPMITIRKKDEKQQKKLDITGKPIKERKGIETFDLRKIPFGLNYSERVEGWDDETEEIRKNVLRNKVGAIDKEKETHISKLDQYDINLDKPKERKLRRNMKNAFKVEDKKFNPFQYQSDKKRHQKERERNEE
ncbi:ubiquitin carboxyl-terminal hydrolase domain containing protein [Entamoeba histolytica HM-1:IMSS-B]|uniref:ubiquitinyl hydrolase 1 n=6 Tax=Entamoeba histolytica TaxID=5759 RepID=C4M772_ENTH1|nr:ubiquitin carboxyl-terminal hydrolase family protein [Entamoeba histolytica HM-1:IMSS]EMD43311.1 ubiquitin carboxylterminal hydrolase family protein [Entamoeba histolytica KU27]EMH76062.1 ubiquitin carboxyl-terminal hydrolase domain containing protein [Entamoeba histolytica HM-1:IMSS-B]EMS13082.1 ubiquitin carboxyl-terminal hydrolase family protein [Entamoeba histolytica HM-3:IMSS]ENY62186.1 ubiquitin carboxyl-terminal hydrolase family protein, putative [Entamoeba histolytica HM-1:IMSS-A]GA|eukprot:XP_654739.1 ubiquitin carboxyl-terminal hydrolase family protein [Entamoeba histolytica HM-1:IMSS]